jgi:hypothetical protein
LESASATKAYNKGLHTSSAFLKRPMTRYGNP